jgi:hypothetical protein
MSSEKWKLRQSQTADISNDGNSFLKVRLSRQVDVLKTKILFISTLRKYRLFTKMFLENLRIIPSLLDVLQLQGAFFGPCKSHSRRQDITDLAAIELLPEVFVDPFYDFLLGLRVSVVDCVQEHLEDTLLFSFIHVIEVDGEVDARLDRDVKGFDTCTESA